MIKMINFSLVKMFYFVSRVFALDPVMPVLYGSSSQPMGYKTIQKGRAARLSRGRSTLSRKK